MVITEERARELLMVEIKRHRTAADAAAAIGISHSYLCDIMQAKRPRVPDRVLRYLGLERVVTIRRLKRAPRQSKAA